VYICHSAFPASQRKTKLLILFFCTRRIVNNNIIHTHTHTHSHTARARTEHIIYLHAIWGGKSETECDLLFKKKNVFVKWKGHHNV